MVDAHHHSSFIIVDLDLGVKILCDDDSMFWVQAGMCLVLLSPPAVVTTTDEVGQGD